MFCQNCGKQISETTSFCVFCGNQVRSVNQYNTEINKSNLSRNNIRNEEIEELKRMINYFSLKQNNIYQALEECSSKLKSHDEQKSRALLILGIIFTASFGVFLLSVLSYFEKTKDAGISFFLLVFFFLFTAAPGLLMISGYKKYSRAFEVKRNVILKEYYDVANEFKNQYLAYQNCPIGIEYCTPEILSCLLEIILSGRADTIKEALNIVVDDSKYRALSEKLSKIQRNTSTAATNAGMAAIFSAANLMS